MTENQRWLAWHEKQGNEKAAAYYRKLVEEERARHAAVKNKRIRKKKPQQIGKRVV